MGQVDTGKRPYKIPRRYRKDEPEEMVTLHENYNIGGAKTYTISQVKDHQEFWRLTCSCDEYSMPKPGQAYSCQHLVSFMSEHQDVQPPRTLDPFVLVTAARVPAIVAHIALGDPDSNGYRSVQVMVPRPTDQEQPWEHNAFLGLIHANEGRWTVRQLLLEYLVERLEEDVWDCGNPSHTPAPFEQLDRNMTDRGTPNFKVMADVFDLITTGYCRRCNEDTMLPF